VNQSPVNVFQTVRLLADAFDLVNLDMSSLQQSSGLPGARIAQWISDERGTRVLVVGGLANAFDAWFSTRVVIAERYTRLTMASVFGDESADETRQRVFAVAGLEGAEPEWKALEEKWIARTGEKEFHAADCESEYANDPDPQKHKNNLALYADLATLIARSSLRGFGVALDLAGHREFFPDVPQDISYMKCFTEVLKHFIQNSATSPEHPLEFTFDHRQESEYHAGLLYSSMINWNEWSGRDIFLRTKISFDSRKNPPIQAADLLARETMKHLDNMVGPVRRGIKKPCARWHLLKDRA